MTYLSSNEWKLPLNIAIAAHVLLALSVVYLPHLLAPKPRFEDIYTVNLINVADILPAMPAAETTGKPEPASPPPKISSPNITQKVTEQPIELSNPIIADPVPIASPAPGKAISIKPSKRKVKTETPRPEPQKTAVKKPQNDLSKSRRQQLAEMIRAEQQAAEEARILAEEAEIERKLAEANLNRMKQAAAKTTSSSTSRTSSSSQSGNKLSALENQYYIAIISRLQAIWSLPEYKDWEPSLMASVIITINKDGRIAKSYFEHQSGDNIFDRFVTKALQDVGQFPPIPAAMKKQQMEVGLRFKPGGIN